MSWMKTFEGDVDYVGVELAKAYVAAHGAEREAHAMASYMVKRLFDAAKKEGEKLLLKVESSGHIDQTGEGTVIVTVTSAVQHAPAAEAPKGEGAGTPA